jgi:hypothetical protein
MKFRISRAIGPAAMVVAVGVRSLIVAGPMIERALDHLVAGG